MVFLTGDTRSRHYLAWLQVLKMGRMLVKDRFQPYPGEPWGFDCGTFALFDFKSMRVRRSWDPLAYLRRFEWVAQQRPRPYMAVLPDLICAGNSSVSFSIQWIPLFRRYRLPVYLAVQDGVNDHLVGDLLSGDLDGLFLGGSDAFKQETAAEWCQLAHLLKRKFHYGRAGTVTKLQHAVSIGADSADSAFILWNRERFQQFATLLGGSPVVPVEREPRRRRRQHEQLRLL